MRLIIFLFFISFAANSQIKIIDNASQKPISNVEIYSNKGALLNTTNELGECDNIKSSDYPLTFSHFLYHNLECKTLSTTVKLHPKSIILDDVVVNAISNEYIIIEGYYRGFQTKNDSLDIFTDAKIKWILKAKDYKSMGYEILSSRFFLSKKYNFYKHGGMFLGMKINTLPHLQDDFKHFQKTKNTNNLIGFNFDDLHGQEKTIKLLGNISRILINEDEIFTSSEKYPFENLKFYNHKHKLVFSPKKSNLSYKYEAIDEFMPTHIYYSNELPKIVQKRILIKDKSNFDNNYWEQFEKNPNFKKLPQEIIHSFEKSMELVK
jgi:hypothetical protein